jgi:Bacterial transcriptional activator domain
MLWGGTDRLGRRMAREGRMARRMSRWWEVAERGGTARLEAFSDGVFAIAAPRPPPRPGRAGRAGRDLLAGRVPQPAARHRAHPASQLAEAALAAYRDAAGEYRGDLLSEHPYDDWTLLLREHYRVRLLGMLGRTAQLAFATGWYLESVESGQRLLALDFCREDVHRLLMRAYARLGQLHLAVHQFEICSRQLRQELEWRRRGRPSTCTAVSAPGPPSDRRPLEIALLLA